MLVRIRVTEENLSYRGEMLSEFELQSFLYVLIFCCSSYPHQFCRCSSYIEWSVYIYHRNNLEPQLQFELERISSYGCSSYGESTVYGISIRYSITPYKVLQYS